jgi:F0F1-type ATP synthase assembly protein I
MGNHPGMAGLSNGKERELIMDLSNQGLLIILIVGVVAGWLAGLVMQGTGFGLVGDLIVGLVGAFIGDLAIASSSRGARRRDRGADRECRHRSDRAPRHSASLWGSVRGLGMASAMGRALVSKHCLGGQRTERAFGDVARLQ